MPMARQWKGLLHPQTTDWQTNLGYLIGSAISNNIVQKREAQDQANMYQDMANLNGQFDQLGAPQTNTVDSNAPALVKNFDQGSFGTANFSPGLLKGAATAYGGDIQSAGDTPNTDGSAAGTGGLLSSPQYSFDKSLQKQQQPQRTMDSVADYAKNVQTTTTPGASLVDRTKMIKNQIPQLAANFAKKYPGQMATIMPMILQTANQKIDDLTQQHNQQQISTLMGNLNNSTDLKGAMPAILQLGQLGVKVNPSLALKAYGNPDLKSVAVDLGGTKQLFSFNPKTGAYTNMWTGEVSARPMSEYQAARLASGGGSGGGRGGRVAASPMDKYGASMNRVNDQALYDEYQARVANGDFLTQAEQHRYNQATARLNAYTQANGGYGQDESAGSYSQDDSGGYSPQDVPQEATQYSQEDQPTEEEIALYKQMYGL